MLKNKHDFNSVAKCDGTKSLLSLSYATLLSSSVDNKIFGLYQLSHKTSHLSSNAVQLNGHYCLNYLKKWNTVSHF